LAFRFFFLPLEGKIQNEEWIVFAKNFTWYLVPFYKWWVKTQNFFGWNRELNTPLVCRTSRVISLGEIYTTWPDTKGGDTEAPKGNEKQKKKKRKQTFRYSEHHHSLSAVSGETVSQQIT
jgi:hypothetical protein